MKRGYRKPAFFDWVERTKKDFLLRSSWSSLQDNVCRQGCITKKTSDHCWNIILSSDLILSNFIFHFMVLFKNLYFWTLLACGFCIETCQAFGFQVALIRSTEYNNSLVHICSDSYHVMIANLFNGVPPPSTLPCRMWHWPHHFYRYPYGTKLMKMKRIVVW